MSQEKTDQREFAWSLVAGAVICGLIALYEVITAGLTGLVFIEVLIGLSFLLPALAGLSRSRSSPPEAPKLPDDPNE